MLDLKALLTKILKCLCVSGAFTYQNNTAIASSNLSANSTFYLPSQNTGGTYSHYVSNTSFFGIDHNGFITTKSGMYHVSMSGHLNSQNTGAQGFAIQIYDWTSSAQISYARFAYTATSWCPIALELTVPLEAGHIIVPRIERYSGSTGRWKISNLQFTLTYLGEGQYVTA